MSWVGVGLSAVGGITKLAGSLFGRKKRIAAQRKANAELAAQKRKLEAIDLSNPYADMENVYEDLTINQQQADYQTQQTQINQANTMQALQGAAGGSGIAGLAQQLMNQGQQAAQQTAATIGQQEAQNQAKAAAGAASVQQQKAAGQQWSVGQQMARTKGQLSAARGAKAAADQARSQAATNQMSAFGDILGSVAGGVQAGQENIASGGTFWKGA